jgi:hypothetical protein
MQAVAPPRNLKHILYRQTRASNGYRDLPVDTDQPGWAASLNWRKAVLTTTVNPKA